MVAPLVLGFAIFGVFPIILSFILSFAELHTYDIADVSFVGFRNFIFVFKDERFLRAIANTLLFSLNMPICMILSLVVAVLLNRIKILKKLFQTVYFLPYVLSGVAIATMWKWMLDTNYGIINDFVTMLGGSRVEWLTNEKYFMLSMIILSVWSGMCMNIIFFLSAIANVNPELYEAADMDGASSLTKFFKITLPIISPTTFYLFVTGVIGTLQSFVIFQVMGGTTAGPNESGMTIVFYLYNMAFRDTISYGMGYASATAWILAIAIIILTVFNFILSGKWVYSDD